MMRSEASRGDQLVSSLKTKLSNVPQVTSECCIYKVPITLRELSPEAYTPKLLSIGPFHLGTPRLQPMEVHKLRYLHEFLKREPEKPIEFYIETLKGLEERTRQQYDGHINLTSDEFVQMMLIDGCFIIEFILRSCKVELRDKNDPLWIAHSMPITLAEDMRLLENQLPFFVIDCLFNQLNNKPGGQGQVSFLGLSLDFFNGFLQEHQDNFLKNYNCQVKHFVDLLRQSYVPSHERRSHTNNDYYLKLVSNSTIGKSNDYSFKFIPSATALKASGIKFKKSKEKCFLDISYNRSEFIIPPILITDSTEHLFRNLMAWGYFNSCENYVNDYIILMDSLINTPKDVSFLRKRGIILNCLGDDERMSTVFSKLRMRVYTDISTFYYAELCENVNAYFHKRWSLWRATLRRELFVAGFIILVCTVIQTVCSVISLMTSSDPINHDPN